MGRKNAGDVSKKDCSLPLPPQPPTPALHRGPIAFVDGDCSNLPQPPCAGTTEVREKVSRGSVVSTRPSPTSKRFIGGWALVRPLLSDPGGGGGGCLGPWLAPADPPTHPHQKNFPRAKNEIYLRGRKFYCLSARHLEERGGTVGRFPSWSQGHSGAHHPRPNTQIG